MLGLFSRSSKTSEASAEATSAGAVAAGSAAPVDHPTGGDAISPQTNSAASLPTTANLVGNSTGTQDAPSEPNARKSSKRISLRSMLSGDKRDARAARRRNSTVPVAASDRLRIRSRNASRPPLFRSRSQERARQSALVVRSLIVGPHSNTRTSSGKGVPHTKLHRVKAELMQNKSANKVIAELRTLPSSGELSSVSVTDEEPSSRAEGPIHAVSLAFSDGEVNRRHFAQLKNATPEAHRPSISGAVNRTRSLDLEALSMARIGSVATASLEQVSMVLSQVDVISLVASPGMGIGEPGDGTGLLSGAVPTAKTVLQGIEKVTPELMALGYATGQVISPDHSVVYPPTDRMSVITYWWGFELVLPSPSMEFLSHAPSIAHAIMNFLTALAIVDGGIREILPFVRYISQYVDDEFAHIKEQDQGQGVVCAATWLIPVALSPRPWDFPDPSTKPPPAPSDSVPTNVSSGPVTGASTPVSPTLAPPPVTTDSPPAPPVEEVPLPVVGTDVTPGVDLTPPTPPAGSALSQMVAVAA